MVVVVSHMLEGDFRVPGANQNKTGEGRKPFPFSSLARQTPNAGISMLNVSRLALKQRGCRGRI